MIGKTITHYIIQRELGRGGMEIVYKALDSRLNRTVALKLLPYYLSSSPTKESDSSGKHRLPPPLTIRMFVQTRH
jgi:serine/threonine protein kinase